MPDSVFEHMKLLKNFPLLFYIIKAKEWVNLFTSLSAKGHGYKKANVTPYMHGMVYHVPYFMRQHNGIKKFTGQGKTKPSN